MDTNECDFYEKSIMIESLKLKNVGPAPDMSLDFGKRLNLLTGDNGLGKSFILDVAWWAMTRNWPSEINPNLTGGNLVLPRNKKDKAEIAFSFSAVSTTKEGTGQYEPREQAWKVDKGRPANPGFVFYAMADGSFAVWDPARNYRKPTKTDEGKERPAAYVFSPKEVWDGIQRPDGSWVCNGLLRDWAGWQKENGRAFQNLSAVLEALSPSNEERIEAGALTRISLDDVRDMPTLKMAYGMEAPVIHASSGMRRIIALAYFLVWCWEEHLKAKELLGEEPETKSVFLVDEVEAHLHPKWQRTIINSLMKVMDKLTGDSGGEIQIIVATHSPLIMASAEPLFDEGADAWFDLDLEGEEVKLRKRDFEQHGDASTWLMSKAFDLGSSRSVESENLIEEASRLLDLSKVSAKKVKEIHEKLITALNPKDDFLFQWRYIGKKKGWRL